jgi:DNA repair exonuclease SbcCD ATPase subunit
MFIKNLQLKNFKGFDDVIINLTQKNILSGKNGAGKSAIKDAIIFALYNRTPDGSAQKTDTFIKRGTPVAEVSLELESGHKISRKRSEKASTVNFIDFSQSEEDARVAQRDLEGTAIPLFERFVNVFLPGYFMQTDEKEQRAFIMSLTPPIDRKALFLKAGGDEKMCLKYEIDCEDWNEAFAIAKRERLELKKIKDESAAKIDYIEEQIGKFPKKESSYGELEQSLYSVREAIKAKKAWIDFHAKSEALGPIHEKNEAIKKELNELDKIDIKIPEGPNRDILNRLEAAIKMLPTVHIPVGTCPSCRQMVQVEHRDFIENLNKENAKKRAVLEKEWTEEEAKYNTLSRERENALKATRELSAKKYVVKAGIIEITPLSEPSLDEPKETLDALVEEERATSTLMEHMRSLDDMKRKLMNARTEHEEVDSLAKLFSPSGLPSIEAAEKKKPIEEAIKKFFPTAEIILMRLLKNGMEYKDTFDIEISGKPYSRLSSGEQKKLDFALSLVFDDFLKEVGMVFVDDADLVDSSGLEAMQENAKEKGVQLFFSHVTEGELSITNA